MNVKSQQELRDWLEGMRFARNTAWAAHGKYSGICGGSVAVDKFQQDFVQKILQRGCKKFAVLDIGTDLCNECHDSWVQSVGQLWSRCLWEDPIYLEAVASFRHAIKLAEKLMPIISDKHVQFN